MVLAVQIEMKSALTTLALMSSLLGINRVHAVTVSSTADSGPGSLREAITSAAPGDSINFAVTGTITLTSGELLVTKNLNIVGPGAANLIIQRDSAAPEFRLINVDGGIVTISGLSFNNGRSAFGGGILNSATL